MNDANATDNKSNRRPYEWTGYISRIQVASFVESQKQSDEVDVDDEPKIYRSVNVYSPKFTPRGQTPRPNYKAVGMSIRPYNDNVTEYVNELNRQELAMATEVMLQVGLSNGFIERSDELYQRLIRVIERDDKRVRMLVMADTLTGIQYIDDVRMLVKELEEHTGVSPVKTEILNILKPVVSQADNLYEARLSEAKKNKTFFATPEGDDQDVDDVLTNAENEGKVTERSIWSSVAVDVLGDGNVRLSQAQSDYLYPIVMGNAEKEKVWVDMADFDELWELFRSKKAIYVSAQSPVYDMDVSQEKSMSLRSFKFFVPSDVTSYVEMGILVQYVLNKANPEKGLSKRSHLFSTLSLGANKEEAKANLLRYVDYLNTPKGGKGGKAAVLGNL